MCEKVAIVTGSNKGIGFGIVRALCKRGVDVVYLTSPDLNTGLQAVETLKKEGINPAFHQLDVVDQNSVKIFAHHIKKKHGGIDILINNAGVGCPHYKYITYEDAKYVIDVNYKSNLIIQENLFPLLRDNARVINISSVCGHISNITNKHWIDCLTKTDVSIEDINEFIDWYLKSVKEGTLKEEDFPTIYILAYRISKIAVAALTRVQQREIGRNISINTLSPGFVKTDMTFNYGDMTIDEASIAPIYLALDCDQSLKGKFICHDKSEIDWTDPNIKLLCLNEEDEKILKEMFLQHNTLR